jgi:predicted Zn-dependent peptidase
VRYTINETTLPNGVRVVSVQLPHLNTAFAACYLAVGSIHETPLNNGISHFLEHVALRGGQRFPTYSDVDSAIENTGGYAGASTSPDSTEFHLWLPDPGEVASALGVLGDAVCTPRLRESDIEIERRIIREEILEDKDNDFDIASKLLWPKHPISMCMLGDESNLGKFNRANLAEHHADFYVGLNTVVCAAGNVEHGPVVEAALRSFGGLPTGAGSISEPIRSSGKAPKYRFLRRNYYQTEVSLCFATLSFQDPLRPAFDIACDALASQRTSRLMNELVMRRGLVYSLDCRRAYHGDSGIFAIKAQMENSKVGKVVDLILEAVRGLRESGLSDDELVRMKRMHSGDIRFIVDNPDRMAEAAGRDRLLGADADPAEQARKYQDVTPDEVALAARSAFSPGRLALVAAGEFKKGQREKIKSALAGWLS